MNHWIQSSPSLISRANALKQSKEQQGEHKKLEKSLNILEEKRKKLWLFQKHFSHSFCQASKSEKALNRHKELAGSL